MSLPRPRELDISNPPSSKFITRQTLSKFYLHLLLVAESFGCNVCSFRLAPHIRYITTISSPSNHFTFNPHKYHDHLRSPSLPSQTRTKYNILKCHLLASFHLASLCLLIPHSTSSNHSTMNGPWRLLKIRQLIHLIHEEHFIFQNSNVSDLLP